MRNFFFPKRFFPSRLSIVAYILFLGSLITLVMTIGIMPSMYGQLDKVYQPPKILNTLTLVGFLGGMGLYAVERRKHRD